MNPIAAILLDEGSLPNTTLIKALHSHPLIEKGIIVQKPEADTPEGDFVLLKTPYPLGGAAVLTALEKARPCPFILFIPSPRGVGITAAGIDRLLQKVRAGTAGLYYADYYEDTPDPAQIRMLIDYQAGSIRDDFSFGPLLICQRTVIDTALGTYGRLGESRWAGFYELRLKVSRCAPVVRIPEPLALVRSDERKIASAAQFDYVDPARLQYQQEMEAVASEHLRSIGAYVEPVCRPLPQDSAACPVEASVVIPVRNREKTVADAIKSALSQKTAFPFNVIVVQNHSTDRTGEKIREAAAGDSRVVTIVPARTDRGIGGCWNEAVMSPHCGRYVCQLDSDDLYADEDTLSTMVEMLCEGCYGMVVGTYRVVNFSLQEIPPGLVEHREWTEENGRNNLLRVHGIGAPRAFPACVLRQFPFPDVSYGEDYAAALRISREYRVGRIFKPVYLCRRWEGNSDANLSREQENRYARYKDSLRTREILERIESSSGEGTA